MVSSSLNRSMTKNSQIMRRVESKSINLFTQNKLSISPWIREMCAILYQCWIISLSMFVSPYILVIFFYTNKCDVTSSFPSKQTKSKCDVVITLSEWMGNISLIFLFHIEIPFERIEIQIHPLHRHFFSSSSLVQFQSIDWWDSDNFFFATAINPSIQSLLNCLFIQMMSMFLNSIACHLIQSCIFHRHFVYSIAFFSLSLSIAKLISKKTFGFEGCNWHQRSNELKKGGWFAPKMFSYKKKTDKFGRKKKLTTSFENSTKELFVKWHL